MKYWVVAILVLTILAASGGCSSSAPEVSAALAPATDAAGSGTRSASSLSWGPPTVLDSTPPHCKVGMSLAIIAGNPAVSYVVWSDQGQEAGFTLYYARANDSTGTSWGDPTALTFWPDPYDYDNRTSLRDVNGKPAIAYNSFPNGHSRDDVRFVRAKDAYGSKWGTPIIVDPYTDRHEMYQGIDTSLHIVNGNPAVWHRDGNIMQFVRSKDPNGSNWGSPQDVGPLGTISIVNGYPALRYVDSGVLYFRRAADANGDSWLDPVVIGYGSSFNSLDTVNGQPAVTYGDNGELYYCRATDAYGDSWGAPVDLGFDNGLQSPFAIVNGQPAVTYSDGSGGLYFRRAEDANGDSWGAEQSVLADATPASKKQLVDVDGYPAIVFSGKPTAADSSVRFIRALDADGATWPPSPVDITVPGGESVEWIHSVAFINGLPSVYFRSGINVAAEGDPPAYDTKYFNFVQALDSSGSVWEAPETVIELSSAYAAAVLPTTFETGAGIAFTDGWHSMNFVTSLPAPPDPAVIVQLSTDKSAYVIGQDTDAVLTAVVTDEYGDPISGLSSGAFATTLDDGSVVSAVTVNFSESATAGTYTGNLDISGLSSGDYTVQTTVTDPRDVSGFDSTTFSMNEQGAGGTMHVGDLDASIQNGPHNRWRVTFTVMIGDSSHSPVSGADVAFSLSGDQSGSGQVTTGSDGTASYQTGWIKGSGSVTFTVDDVTHATLTYSPGDNHDDDGDSDGTSITATGP